MRYTVSRYIHAAIEGGCRRRAGGAPGARAGGGRGGGAGFARRTRPWLSRCETSVTWSRSISCSRASWTSRFGPGEALPHGLRFEPLFASDRMLIVPRGHVLAGKKRPTLRDLARHAFVIPPARSRWRREAGCPWAGDAGGYRRLIRNGRRDAVAGGGGEEGYLIDSGRRPSAGHGGRRRRRSPRRPTSITATGGVEPAPCALPRRTHRTHVLPPRGRSKSVSCRDRCDVERPPPRRP
jgi:hypothetical protein